MPMRPASSTCIVLTKPCPSSPSSWSAGMRQFSNSTSLVSLARIPSLSSFLPGVMPGVPRLDDERGDAFACRPLRSVTAITTMMSPTRPCVVKVFDPFSTQHVAVARRRRAHAGGVAARGRFGQSPRADLLAARERHQVRLLLRFGAEQEDVRRAEAVVRRDRQRDARDRRAPAPRCRCSSRSADMPAPPYCFGKLDADQPERRQLAARARTGNAAPRPTRGRADGSQFPRTRARFAAAAPALRSAGSPSPDDYSVPPDGPWPLGFRRRQPRDPGAKQPASQVHASPRNAPSCPAGNRR